MSKWMDYGREAVAYASPYIKQVGAYAEETAGRIGKSYRKSRKLLKRDMRLARINRVLSFISNVFLILASVAALIALVQNLLVNDD